MKRISFIIIFFLLSTSVFYGFELKLEDKYSFHYESRKIDYLNFFYFHDFLIFNDIYYVRNDALVPIFNLNEDFYNFYAKYEISCELLMNRDKNELYYRFFSLIEKKTFYCIKLTIETKNNSLKKEEVDYELVKDELIEPEWIKFPYQLFDNLVINYKYDSKLKNSKCEILKNTGTVFNFDQYFSDKDLIYPPELNKHNTKITFLTKSKNLENELFLKNNEVKCELFLFSITYQGQINDKKVRLRSEPDLDCEILGYLDKSDEVKIHDLSNDKFVIEGEEWYWYKVSTQDGTIGWVYGKYLDIEN